MGSGWVKNKFVGIVSTVCVCGAFLLISQSNVLADSASSTVHDDTIINPSSDEATTNSNSIALTSETSANSNYDTVEESDVSTQSDSANSQLAENTAASASYNDQMNVDLTSADSTTTSASNASSQNSVTDVNSANIIDLGVVDSTNQIEEAKSAAMVLYEQTGQAQTITAMEATSYSYTDAFLDSIRSGAIQGWVDYGILPSVTAAQAICESAWGRSALATQAHNLFGIKGSYNGQSITYPTKEWGGGGYYTINAAFRRYNSNSESVQDHGSFLVSNSRYANLIGNRNYVSVANNLQSDGYATSPTYASTLINIVNSYGLTSWDAAAFYLTDHVNTGHLDSVTIENGNLSLSGWHAATDSTNRSHRFIILLDASNNKEIARINVNSVGRGDVENAYSNVAGSYNSGFSILTPYTDALAGKNITVVSRYSSANDGNSDFVDFNFSLDLRQNSGNLDSFSIDSNGKLNISGWHASDQSLGKLYHTIIIYDMTKNVEIARYNVSNAKRSDVHSAHTDIYNSLNSGFGLSVDFTDAMAGDNLRVVSRYSSKPNGQVDSIDYWFNEKIFNRNDGYLDNFNISGDYLNVSGWNASDYSVGKNYHFIILYDKTKEKEVGRVLVNNSYRSDVAAAENGVYKSGTSAFSANFKLTSSIMGDELLVVSRYSSNKNDDGAKSDYWFNNSKRFNVNVGNVDSIRKTSTGVDVSGWHASDYTVSKPYNYIIVWDATANKELGRILVSNNVKRSDVSKLYSNVYNSLNSGFDVTIDKINIPKNHEIQIVNRYSENKNGEGNAIDIWSNKYNI